MLQIKHIICKFFERINLNTYFKTIQRNLNDFCIKIKIALIFYHF